MESGATQLGRGETIADTARVPSRFVDAIMLRTDDHQNIVDLARYAPVPVINGLTDDSHPCQLMADLLPALARRGGLAGLRWAWPGVGHNVLLSFSQAASRRDFRVGVGVLDGN